MTEKPGRLPWGKFYWDAWLSDPALSSCGPAARGVWIDWLCYAARATPRGYLTVGGNRPTMRQLAQMGRCNVLALPKIMDELERHGVFSRTAEGVIFSRRMVRDAVTEGGTYPRATLEEGGTYPKGEHENYLSNQSVNHPIEERRIEERRSERVAKATPKKIGSRLPEGWAPSEADRQYAADLGLDVDRTADDFRGYWLSLPGAKAVKLDWSLTWRGWCRRESDKRGTKGGSTGRAWAV